ncbi:MAG: MTH938/NDUFAF3 family protein [Thermodesulfobacteriota bacterium]
MIEEYSFGRMVVNGTVHGADLKIVGSRVVAGWWRNSGHAVEVSDVADILVVRPEVLVIGQGSPGLMKVTESMKKELALLGIDLIEEPTAGAALTFNRLRGEGREVAAGFHLTC